MVWEKCQIWGNRSKKMQIPTIFGLFVFARFWFCNCALPTDSAYTLYHFLRSTQTTRILTAIVATQNTTNIPGNSSSTKKSKKDLRCNVRLRCSASVQLRQIRLQTGSSLELGSLANKVVFNILCLWVLGSARISFEVTIQLSISRSFWKTLPARNGWDW